MTALSAAMLKEVLTQPASEIVDDWLREQQTSFNVRNDLISEADLRRESIECISLLSGAVASSRPGDITDITASHWAPMRDFLAGISRSRSLQNFTPGETAAFVFSLKPPLFSRLKKAAGADADALAREVMTATILLDKLGMFTFESFLLSRENIIKRQQEEMLELSTPVVKLWDGILALPLIGTLDSARTQVIMESLLRTIVETGSGIAIIDITGVPAVDTLVAQHLLLTVAAARLMGAQCIISGIRPQIAQTMVHLGVAFGDVVTKASLADALSYAFRQTGIVVSQREAHA
jgi:rsbT co-antagonist protein RsbR